MTTIDSTQMWKSCVAHEVERHGYKYEDAMKVLEKIKLWHDIGEDTVNVINILSGEAELEDYM